MSWFTLTIFGFVYLSTPMNKIECLIWTSAFKNSIGSTQFVWADTYYNPDVIRIACKDKYQAVTWPPHT